MKRFIMLGDKTECMDDPLKEGSCEGEGDGIRGVACAEIEVVVEAESTTIPEPVTVELEEEEEAHADTIRSDGPSNEPSTEDVEPCIGQNRKDV